MLVLKDRVREQVERSVAIHNKGTHRLIATPRPKISDEEYKRRREEEYDERAAELREMQMGDLR